MGQSIMPDLRLIEAFPVQEYYVDGFAAHATRDGVMSCAGYRKTPEGNIIVIRLVWPAVNTLAAIDEAARALNEPPPDTKTIKSKTAIH